MPQTVKERRVSLAAAVLVLSAAVVIVETYLWNSRKYYLTSVIMILLAMLPFFARFERRRPQVREIVLLAVMTAFAVAGRAAFYWAPQFKPVCAIVILTLESTANARITAIIFLMFICISPQPFLFDFNTAQKVKSIYNYSLI